MDLQLIPILSSFSTLLVFFQQRLRGWRAVSLSLLSLFAIGWGVPGCRPLLGLGSLLWFGFILVPLQAFAFVNHLIQQEQFGDAVRWMRWTRWLHPWDGWWNYPEMLQGLVLAQAGQMGAARQIFQKYQAGQNAIERMATILLYRIDGRWQSLIEWVTSRPENSAVRRDPNVQLVYLRALGETGQPEALIQHLQQIEQSLRQSGNPGFLHTARMYALAFAGQPDTVSWLLHQNLPPVSAEVRQYWIGTAYWMAGSIDQAKQIFERLRREASPGMQGAIADRFTHQPPDLNRQLSTASRQWIGRLQSWIIQESQYSMRPQASWQKTPVTYTLITVNTIIGIFFALNYVLINLLIAYQERIAPVVLKIIAQPVIYIAEVYQSGVLVPVRILQGSWWQIITATFLHASPVHLIMNMLGLYVLGGLVEPMLGRWRFAIGYLVTGIGSMAIVTGLSLVGLIRETMVVGASGAIMGVLGMMGAVFLQRWRDRKEAMAAQRLRSVVLIALFQTMFDAVTPQVSMAGHLSGVILGFVVGSLLVNRLKSA